MFIRNRDTQYAVYTTEVSEISPYTDGDLSHASGPVIYAQRASVERNFLETTDNREIYAYNEIFLNQKSRVHTPFQLFPCWVNTGGGSGGDGFIGGRGIWIQNLLITRRGSKKEKWGRLETQRRKRVSGKKRQKVRQLKKYGFISPNKCHKSCSITLTSPGWTGTRRFERTRKHVRN